MKNVFQSKNVIFYLFLLFFISCKKEVNFKNFYEKIDSINVSKEKITIEILYKKNNLDYIAEFHNKKYRIPYYFIVEKDTLRADEYSIENSKQFDNEFYLNFSQGNAGLYTYKVEIKNNDFFLTKIIKSDVKLNTKIDSLIINKKWFLIDSEKITKYINK